MKNIKLYLLIICTLFLIFPKSVISGYGEEKGAECYYYKAGKLISYSKCDVKSYFNMERGYSIWDWYNGNSVSISVYKNKISINDKPGFHLKYYRKGLSCWGIRGSNEVLCTSSDAI
jgi:hypothetical protein